MHFLITRWTFFFSIRLLLFFSGCAYANKNISRVWLWPEARKCPVFIKSVSLWRLNLRTLINLIYYLLIIRLIFVISIAFTPPFVGDLLCRSNGPILKRRKVNNKVVTSWTNMTWSRELLKLVCWHHDTACLCYLLVCSSVSPHLRHICNIKLL